jgi:hypothetical protein
LANATNGPVATPWALIPDRRVPKTALISKLFPSTAIIFTGQLSIHSAEDFHEYVIAHVLQEHAGDRVEVLVVNVAKASILNITQAQDHRLNQLPAGGLDE